jgi:hypothetical protein
VALEWSNVEWSNVEWSNVEWSWSGRNASSVIRYPTDRVCTALGGVPGGICADFLQEQTEKTETEWTLCYLCFLLFKLELFGSA